MPLTNAQHGKNAEVEIEDAGGSFVYVPHEGVTENLSDPQNTFSVATDPYMHSFTSIRDYSLAVNGVVDDNSRQFALPDIDEIRQVRFYPLGKTSGNPIVAFNARVVKGAVPAPSSDMIRFSITLQNADGQPPDRTGVVA